MRKNPQKILFIRGNFLILQTKPQCEQVAKVQKIPQINEESLIFNNISRMKRIVLDYGKANMIAKTFKCSREMVSKALHFKKNSELARKIRYVAVKEYGGIEVGK